MREQATLLERDGALRRLERALAAARQQQGRIVSLEGEAGIGKTSLALRFTDAHRRDAQVFVGGCEHLSTPEPLGPLRDIARESEGRFAISTSSQIATFESLLKLLTPMGGRATLLLIEDIHWADDSTLDLLRYLGRRIRNAPILVLVTLRNDEPESKGRLATLWDDIPRDARERVELERLTPDAVLELANAAGFGARAIYDATGGNPFHVTEYLAARPPEVPSSVRDATLARAAALGERARRVLDGASLFPRQTDAELLSALAQDVDHSGVEECLHRGMLNERDGKLAFRHELARRAVHEALAPLRRRSLHAAALRALEARPGLRAAEGAHHAEQAGDTHALLRYSLRAADEARALGSHRESLEHLARALAQPTLPDAERTALLEQQADIAEGCGAFDLAGGALDEAIARHRKSGDVLGLGNALRIAARIHWMQGEADAAETFSVEAVNVLSEAQGSWQYAMALSGQSQLDMLGERNQLAIERAHDAMRLAGKLERWDIYLHALTNSTAAKGSLDAIGGSDLELAAIAEARHLGVPDMLPRLYVNLTYRKTANRLYEDLEQHIDAGIDVSIARENLPLEGYLHGIRAHSLLDRGKLREAIAAAEIVLGGMYPRGLTRFPAQIALTRARNRLGLPDGGAFDAMRNLPTSRRDVMRLAAIAAADAEAQWLGLQERDARASLRESLEMALRSEGHSWIIGDVCIWLIALGEPVAVPPARLASLYPAQRLHVAGQWREAAEAWRALGCPYEQALALCMGDEEAQREALALFDGLGAAPAAARLRRELRVRGARAIPRGPNTTTRANSLGLTARQQQVLALLGEGLTNAVIAKKLHISAKTVEHHVAAILDLLGVRSRAEAVAAAKSGGISSEK